MEETLWEGVSGMLMFSIVTGRRYARSELSLKGDVGKVRIYELIRKRKNDISRAGNYYEECSLK